MTNPSGSLLLDAGDFLFKQWMPPTQRQVGRARLLMDLYAKMGYKAICVGIRDLANSWEFLKKEADARGLSLLSANLLHNGKPVFKPYGIFEVNGVKVAVIGLTGSLPRALLSDGLSLLDPHDALLDLIPRLRTQADFCIVLSNLGYAQDRRLVKDIHGIDVVIGSGPGSRLQRPVRVGDTYLLRGYSKGKAVGKAEIALESDSDKFRVKNYFFLLDQRVFPDPRIEGMVEALLSGPSPDKE